MNKLIVTVVSATLCFGFSEDAVGQEIIYCGERIPLSTSPQQSPDWWASEVVAKSVMERLVEYNSETGAVGPMLAESWEVDDSQTAFTFKLREGVQFQPDYTGATRDFTASDVVATFENLMPENNNGINHGLGSIGQISGVEAIDNFTVRFDFESPQPSFLAELSDPQTSIYTSDYINNIKQGIDDLPPVGTGQWRIENFEPGVRVEYEAFNEHWLGGPAFERMEIVGIQDPTARAAGLAAGDCDVIYLDPGQVDMTQSIANEASILPDQFIATNSDLICYDSGSALGNLASVCIPNAAASNGKDNCPKCPKSGLCPQSIIAARQECCPKSGACGQ